MAKTQKPRRPKAETPRGFRDYFGEDVPRRKAMLDAIAEVYHRYGFDPLETSAVETVEALGKFLPDVDRPNEGVFAWDEGEEGKPDWLALRYDLTAPLARVYAQHRNELPTPYRRYAMGPVWRNEKPGPGRFRQFYQCDADTVGTTSVAADAEICAMLCDALEAVGLGGQYVIRVNNRKVLNGVMNYVRHQAWFRSDSRESLSGPVPHDFDGYQILRTIDKFDKVGEVGVRALLGDGLKDQSGAFIPGAKMHKEEADLIIGFLTARGETNEVTLENLSTSFDHSEIAREGIAELKKIARLLQAQGYGPDRIIIDPSVVRGLGYYTGPVFEAELTFPITDESGQTRSFGSVAGGGRYDDLVTRFTGQAVPATGVSIGVDRLLAALDAKGRAPAQAPGPVVVTVMDRDRMADYQSICATLRNAKIRAEVYLGNPKNFGNQLKYADRRRSPAAIIQGSDEAARGVVQVKDLILGARLAQDASVEEWRENPSQTEISVRDDHGKTDFSALVAHLVGKGLGPKPAA